MEDNKIKTGPADFSIEKPKKWQYPLSHIKAVLLASSVLPRREKMELYLHKGQYRLEYGGAIYSYGDLYYAFYELYPHLLPLKDKIKNVLLLGGGIGAVPAQLEKQGICASYDFVEIDKELIGWTSALMDENLKKRTRFIADDAFYFVTRTREKYDLVLVDIFEEMRLPEFLYDPAWWQSLYYAGHPHTIYAWNTYTETSQEKKRLGYFIKQVISKYLGPVTLAHKDRNMLVMVMGEE